MLSSTSSSSERAPDRNWGRLWVGVAIVTICGLGGLEIVARAAGIKPSYDPSPRLWAHWRDRANGDVVVVLGTSKSQLAVDPEMLAEEFGEPVVNLAVNGSSPIPFLYDLAVDADFSGVVVSGFPHGAIFSDRASWEAKSQRYLTYYAERGFAEPFENAVRFALQGNLAILQPQVDPLTLVRRLFEGRLPEPFYVTMRFDRYQRADYELVAPIASPADDERGAESPRDSTRLDQRSLEARLAKIRDAVGALRERGGEIVFVRHLSSGPALEAEEHTYPREQFAQRFEDATGARVIDFQTLDGVVDITSPDGVHLDYRDVPRYTRALATALKRELPGLGEGR